MPPAPEEAMKFLTLVVIAGVVTAGVLVYANKDDLRRYLEMRQM
jgi:hypothetical protein